MTNKTKRPRITSKKVASSSDYNQEVLQIKGQSTSLKKRIMSRPREERNHFFHNTMKQWFDYSNKFKSPQHRMEHSRFIAGLTADNVINSIKFMTLNKGTGIFSMS